MTAARAPCANGAACGASAPSNSWCVGSIFSHSDRAHDQRHDHRDERQVVVARVAHQVSERDRRHDRCHLRRGVHEPEDGAGMLPPGVEAHGAEVRLLQQDAGVGQRQEHQRPRVVGRHDGRDHEDRGAAKPQHADGAAAGLQPPASDQRVAEQSAGAVGQRADDVRQRREDERRLGVAAPPHQIGLQPGLEERERVDVAGADQRRCARTCRRRARGPTACRRGARSWSLPISRSSACVTPGFSCGQSRNHQYQAAAQSTPANPKTKNAARQP